MKKSDLEKLALIKKVKIINKSNNDLPKYETEFSAGMDLMSNEEKYVCAGERKLIKTGIFIELPIGFEAQIRSRSGLALKNGVIVLNSPGTIDSDYRGEIGVILFNSSMEDFKINVGNRIAQMVISQCEKIEWIQVDKLEDTERGEGGYGSTGK